MNSLFKVGFKKRKSGYKFFSLEVISLLIICLVYRIYFNKHLHIDYNPDTVTYYYAAQRIFKGLIDPFRPPAYPIVIKICGLFNHTDPFKPIVQFQGFVSYISILPFYFCCKHLYRNGYFAYISALIYGCIHSVFYYNKTILAESLLISCLVLLAFIFLIYLKKPTILKGILLNIYLFYLVMLKPVSIYLYLIILIFWVLQLLQQKPKSKAVYGTIGFCISILLVAAFCYLNKIQNNYFGISLVTHDNNFLNVVESKAYKEFDDKKLVFALDSIKRGAYYKVYFINNDHDLFHKQFSIFPYPAPPLMNFVLSVPSSNYKFTKSYVDDQIHGVLLSKTFLNYIFKTFYQFNKTRLYHLNGFIILLTILAETGLILFSFFHYKRILYFNFFVVSITGGLLLSFYLGGFGQAERILIPILPFLIMILFDLVDKIVFHSLSKNKMSAI